MKEEVAFDVQLAIAADVRELARLFDAYRVFYEAAPAPAETEVFIRRLVSGGNTRFFVAREFSGAGLEGPILGFVHLMPSINTVAMRPLWLLEDLFVSPEARSRGAAAALMRYAETFASENGAERLTLATAHDNLHAQSLYKKLGYVRDDHFWYFHRLLD